MAQELDVGDCLIREIDGVMEAVIVKSVHGRTVEVLVATYGDLAKGDYDGHPFRGNQWTDSSGATRGTSGSSVLTAPSAAISQARQKVMDSVVNSMVGIKDFEVQQKANLAAFEAGKPNTWADNSQKNRDAYDAWKVAQRALHDSNIKDAEAFYGDVLDKYNDQLDSLSDTELKAIVDDPAYDIDLAGFKQVYLFPPRETAANLLAERDKAANPPAPDRKASEEAGKVHADLYQKRKDFNAAEGRNETYTLRGTKYSRIDPAAEYESDWQGDSYRAIAQTMWDGSKAQGENAEFARPVIDAFNESMVTLDTKVTLYRGSGALQTAQERGSLDTDFAVGMKIKSKPFLATTTDANRAMDFSKALGATMGHARTDESYPVFRITVAKGVKMLPLNNTDEREVLLHGNVTMTVTGRGVMAGSDGPIEVIDVKVSG